MIGAGNELTLKKRLHDRYKNRDVTEEELKTWDREKDPTGKLVSLKDLEFMTTDDVEYLRGYNNKKLKYRLYFSEYVELIPSFIALMILCLLWLQIFGLYIFSVAMIPTNIFLIIVFIIFMVTRV